MKKINNFQILIFFVLSIFINAQNKDLEFSTASASGNGPALSAAVTFLNNTNNNIAPGNTYVAYNPALTATFAISNPNPKYTTTDYGTGTGNSPVVFGRTSLGGPAASLITVFGGGPTANLFTASGAPLNQGINVGTTGNYGVRTFIGVKPFLDTNEPVIGTYYMADMTITFNRPVNNPILHFSGMGGLGLNDFSGEFELIGLNGSTPATNTFTKLSGTNPLYVTAANYIGNNAAPMNALNPAGVASGSIQVNGTGISTLTFKVYVRGGGFVGGLPGPVPVWDDAADGFTISVSTLETDLKVTKTVNNPTPAVGSNVTFTINASNLGISNSTNTKVTDLLPSGYTFVSASTPDYDETTGIWNIGLLDDGLNETLTIVATVNSTGNYTNTATITGNNPDPDLANNTATVTFPCAITASNPDSDGDGISNFCDLDDDNDGILDTVEKCGGPGFIGWTDAGLDAAPGGNVTTTLAGHPITVTSVVTSSSTGTTKFLGRSFTYSPMVNADAGYPIGGDVQLQIEQTGNTNATTKVTFDILPNKYGDLNVFFSDFEHTNFKIYALDASNNQLPVTNWNVKSYETTGASPATDPNPYTVNATDISFTDIVNTNFDGQNDDTMRVRIDTGTLQKATKIVIETTRSNVVINANDNAEIMLSTSCVLKDTDGDTLPDYLDLDSDNDGCLDALEGGDNLATSNLVNAAGTVTVGTSSTASNQNLCATVYTGTATDCVGSTGIPLVVNQTTGQSVGSSTNSAVKAIACLTPFVCSASKLYTSSGNPTQLSEVTVASGVATYTPTIGSTTTPAYNATAFNPIDGFLYAINASREVLRIDANGVTSNLGTIGLPALVYNAGEIDNVGNYYVKVQALNNTIYKINLTTMTFTSFTLSNSLNVPDLAYNVTTNLLYGVHQGTNQLVSIDPSTGTVIFLGTAAGIGTPVGAMFGAPNGIFGIDGVNFYSFDLVTGARTIISTAPANTGLDGAHCVTAPILFSCYKPATTGAGALTTKHGITALGRAGAETSNGNWPMIRNGAWTALEAKTKGFVVNRMPTATAAQVTATPALKLGEPVNAAGTAAAIATPTKGMMFYDTTVNCMKINTDGTAAGWKCLNTQTCPAVN